MNPADSRDELRAIVKRWENGLDGDAAMGYVRSILATPAPTASLGAAPLSDEGLSETGPGWWHPVDCEDRHDADHNCLDEGGSIIGWRDPIVSARLKASRASEAPE